MQRELTKEELMTLEDLLWRYQITMAGTGEQKLIKQLLRPLRGKLTRVRSAALKHAEALEQMDWEEVRWAETNEA